MVKLALIYPPFLSFKNQPGIKLVQENAGIFPPLSLAQIAAVAKSHGHQTILIDANALKLSKDAILNKIKQFKPDILGFTLTTYTLHQSLEWIDFLKEKTKLPILVGGAHMSFYPKETMMHKSLDYGLIGEAEIVLPNFLKRLDNKQDLLSTPGLVMRYKGKVLFNNNYKILNNLDDAPFPARELLPNDQYYSFISKRRNFTAMVTSRGCPFQCIFCEQKLVPFRQRSAENIFKEILECYQRFGIREIDFFDTTFTINKKRIISLCKLIRKHNLKIVWSVRSRIDTIDKEMLIEMKKAGCIRIHYGIESGDEQVLQNIKKATTIKLVREKISLTKRIGVATFGYFMFGNPGETEETIQKTIKLALSLQLDYAQFSKVSALPGTELYDLWKKHFHQDYWKQYILNEKNAKNMRRYGCNVSNKRIENLLQQTYKKFYFRPNQIIKHL